MKERPIIFSAPMARAILEGRKTQTRRVVKGVDNDNRMRSKKIVTHVMDAHKVGLCPYGQPGDRLWVREAWAKPFDVPDAKLHGRVTYRADFRESPVLGMVRADGAMADRVKWKPSIHMPRWASRITLEITGVRVERLHEITGNECVKEGMPDQEGATIGEAKKWFSDLWESINGAGSWQQNTWVWVVEFRRVQP